MQALARALAKSTTRGSLRERERRTRARLLLREPKASDFWPLHARALQAVWFTRLRKPNWWARVGLPGTGGPIVDPKLQCSRRLQLHAEQQPADRLQIRVLPL